MSESEPDKSSSMVADVMLIRLDDWELMYLNGDMVAEGHHLRASDIFEHLIGMNIRSFVSEFIDYEDLPDYSFSSPPECGSVSEFYELMKKQREEELERMVAYEEDNER